MMSHKKMSLQFMIKVSTFQIKDCALIAIATGKKAHNFVRENLLITRHLRVY